MARPRYTTQLQLTFRLAPSLRDDLEREAHAKGDDLGELVREILADHTARRIGRRSPAGLLLEIDINQLLPGAFDYDARF